MAGSSAQALLVSGAAPGVRTATFSTDPFYNNDNRCVSIAVVASVVTGTSPTLAAKLQWSPDGGTTWIDLDTANAVTANLTAAGSQVCHAGPGLPVTAAKSANVPVPRMLRVTCTIGGTTPSFTLSGVYALLSC